MYTLIVNGAVKVESPTKGVISEEIAKLKGEDRQNYKIFTDCTDEFPSPQEFEEFEARNRTIEALGKNIDFSKFELQMDDEMRRRKLAWENLIKKQTEFECQCGF